MDDIDAQLAGLHPLIWDGTAGPALLSNAAAGTALLNVLAVTLRHPLVNNPGSIMYQASSCCDAVLCCNLPPINAKRRPSFALRLVRTQPLQCYARRLAEVGQELLSLGRGLQHGGPRGREPGRDAAEAQLRQGQVLLKAGLVFTQSLNLVQGLVEVAFGYDVDGSAPPHSERGLLQQELTAALRDSCVLEHAARTLLLQLQLHCEDPLRAHKLFEAVSITSYAPEYGAVAPHAGSKLTDLATALRGLLSGRCVQHAALVLGVAALCAADGGRAYGLPRELLRRVLVLSRRLGPDGKEVGPLVDSHHEEGWKVLDGRHLRFMLHALRVRARGALPGRRGTLALLLRVCRLVVASGRAHLAMRGVGTGVVEADGTAARWHGCGSSAGTSGGGNGGRGGGGSRGADSGSGTGGGGGTDGGDDPLPVLRQCDLWTFFNTALEDAMHTCFPAAPAERPERVAARAECWRLFAAYTREVLPLKPKLPPCSPACYLQDPGPLMPGAPLSATPPPSWEDALAGGWLPCLQRLLRRSGKDPTGGEASLAVTMIATMGDDDDGVDRLLAWRHLAVLLAYGEPRQAAALVATLGELLRAADPAELVGTAPAECYDPVVTVFWALEGACREPEWAEAGAAAASGAEEAVVQAPQPQGGLHGGEQSAAGRQLALMLSCALCEWLPTFAVHIAQAMKVAALPAGQPHSARAAAGALQARAATTAADLLLPFLSWLPLLVQRCSIPVGSEAAAIDRAADDGGGMHRAGSADGRGGAQKDDGRGGWPQLLLEEAGVVPLLGAALQAFASAGGAAAFASSDLRRRLLRACCAVAVACPREVRAAAVSAARVPRSAYAWRPQQMRTLASHLRAGGAHAEADGAEALAVLLDSWEAGGGEVVREAAAVVADARRQSELLAAWRRVGACCALHRTELRCGSALVPVAEAREVLLCL